MLKKEDFFMNKISKRAFIELLGKRLAGTDKNALSAEGIYDLFMETLTDEILKGNTVTLTGFGNFELKPHGGHTVHFSADTKKIDSYLTLRFYSSNVFNKRLRDSGLLALISENESKDEK